jgi:catechol 2,3-dioxygenase-like lactoylglutathione lyase family enzyme
VAEIVGLDHVLIAMPAGGEVAAREFYGTLLGLREVPKPPALVVGDRGGSWFLGGGVALHLGRQEPFTPATKAHVALLVDDLAGLRATLDAAGARTFDDTDAIGVRRFYAFDPFGNRLELIDARDGGFTAPAHR